MSVQDSATAQERVAIAGRGWAALGVLAFSFTFPMTVVALRGLDPLVVGAGRSVIAAVAAAIALKIARVKLPPRSAWPGLLAVAIGCGIGFGLLSALALHHTTSSHAAVVTALLPVATAVVAVLRSGDRPAPAFWAASAVGTVTVVTYALSRGAGSLGTPDVLLLAALCVAAVGYAEGGRLAQTMPGWQVIAWGMLLALPISLPISAVAATTSTLTPSFESLAAFAYLGLFSCFLGFFAWYRGLAEAGVARASQLQLGQPLLTILWSVPLLGDHAGPAALVTAAIVLGCVLVTQRATRPAAARGAQLVSTLSQR